MRRPSEQSGYAHSVTIRDVARVAGVSVASASRALNGLNIVTPALRERVLAAAQALNYVPDTAARALSTRRTDTIGLMLPDLHGEFFSEVIRGADQAARARGLQLLVSTSYGDADGAVAAMRAMRGRVDGLLLMSPHIDASMLAQSLTADFPTVLVNTPIEDCPHPAFTTDNYAGAFAAVAHLIEGAAGGLVAHIAGPVQNCEARERLRGYQAALKGAREHVIQGDFNEESGYAAGLAIAAMSPRPAAVFAANDMMAIGCMLALADQGVSVPGEVILAGFDDIPIARLISPSLTTIRVNISELSCNAMLRLADMIKGGAAPAPGLETVQPTLIIRTTSIPARG